MSRPLSATRLQDAGRTLLDLPRRRRTEQPGPPAPDLPARLAAMPRLPGDHHRLTGAAQLLDAPPGTLLAAIAATPDPEAVLDALAGAEGGLRGLLALRAEAAPGSALDPALRRRLAPMAGRWTLRLERVGRESPAALLERIIATEAVHEIQGWGDLRRRLDPLDRRRWAYLHPALPNEPLVFTEVALTRGLADSVQAILFPARQGQAPDSATFCSISACQPGLRGIGLGDSLIQDAAAALAREGISQVGTLSPMPGFRRRLVERAGADGLPRTEAIDALLDALPPPEDPVRAQAAAAIRRAGARYLLEDEGKRPPTDPVARFHLGNGAEAWRLNPFADLSANGRRRSFGLMVDYRYDRDRIRDRQAARHGNHARAVSDLLRAAARRP